MTRLLLVSAVLAGLALSAGSDPTRAAQLKKEPARPLGPMTASSLVDSNNAFAADLYRRVRIDHKGDLHKGNLFFAPVSIMSALGMTSLGARGETQAQMRRVLRLSADDLTDSLGTFINGLSLKNARGTNVSLATGLWAQKGLTIEPGFGKVAQRMTGRPVGSLDFAKEAEPARRTINDWVERKTDSRIKDLLPPGSVTRNTKLVLCSAVHFKGDWAWPFKPDLTREADFHGIVSKVRVPLMIHRREFPYARITGLHLLELPFAGEELGMVFILPEKAEDFEKLETKLTGANLTKWMGHLKTQRVDVFLPRFKLIIQYPLSQFLTAMGMGDAFGAKANFTGIEKTGKLQLSEAFHRAYVTVTEQGAEAGAATGVLTTPKSIEPRAPQFRADRPFVFLVRDRRSGTILFVGRLAQPIVKG